MPSLYRDLNLNEGASLGQIKAAFRALAKAHHPDAAGTDSADVEKFIKAQTAYQKLLKTALAHNRSRRAVRPETEPDYLWLSREENDLDIIYRLVVRRPAPGGECRLLLPARAREACPRCLGQGRTLARVGRHGLYRPSVCPKCEGRGSLEREISLAVTLKAERIGVGKIRLRRAGLYHAPSARRGDLILELTWVDRLPAAD